MYAIVPTDKLERDHRDIVPGLHVTLTPRGMFAFSPCTADGDHLYWFFSSSVAVPSEDSREGWEAFGREEVSSCKDTISGILQNAKGPWIARIRDIVAKSDTIKFYPVYTMPSLPTWSSKRCLLLGDAAHAMPPHTGQGTSMALEDAFLLTRLLKDASRPLSEVFRKFEEIRRPRTEKLSKRSSQRGSDRENRGPLAHRAKELAIGFGFWLYRTAHLEKLGWSIIDSGDEVSYNIMEEEI
jgi:2-polyprenyl-6-methoxyphenol hydroxylase-like FAD-dependent oxidoreductase